MGDAWQNPVKQRLRDGQPVFGCTMTTASLDMAVRAATAGFDFLWLEMEHATLSLESVRNIVLATRPHAIAAFARVPVTEAWTAKRVLDAGVHGVVFPFVSSPAQAVLAAGACRYPPLGHRGSGASLAAASWPGAGSYYDSADCEVVVVAMVEEAAALAHLDDIAATPGVDVIFIGTGDMSFSFGLRGQQDHPRIEEAAAAVLDAARRHGKVAGRPAVTAEHAARYVDQGHRFIQAPSDLALFDLGAKSFLARLRP